MDGKYVFISYKAEEFNEANWVKQTLEDNGIPCWMAPDSIPGGSSYATEIENAIKNCTVFVLVLSEKAQSSKWVSKEVDRAINFAKRVMPFTLDNSPLKDDFSFYLSNVQRYDATTDKLSAMQTMIEAIRAEFNAPQSNVVFKKKPPKSKNDSKGKKSKLLKPALIILVVIAVLICGINLFSDSITSDDANKTSLYQADTETTKATENNFQSWFDNKEETANPYEELLNNLTFELDGVTYSLPCDFSELYANGWEPQTYNSINETIYHSSNISIRKKDSIVSITVYDIYDSSCELINSKVGKITYEPDCNVSFSVNGNIKPGSHYDEIVAEFGEPKLNDHLPNGYSNEYMYNYNYDQNITFECYSDTSRCYKIELKNFIYEKEY